MKWVGYVARMGKRRGAYCALVRKREGRRLFERRRCRLEDNIKIDFSRSGRGMDWIDLVQNRDRCRAFVNSVMNLRVP